MIGPGGLLMEVPNLFAVSVYGWVAKTTRVHWPVTEQLRVQGTGGVQREEEEKRIALCELESLFFFLLLFYRSFSIALQGRFLELEVAPLTF
jgi:hypothetical protein